MAGRNLFKAHTNVRKGLASTGSPCVFISHRKYDAKAAETLARYLTEDVGVDVYIDLQDNSLSSAVRSGKGKLVVEYIEAGIRASTHLLGVISPQTKGSWWVPYEIGTARQHRLGIAYVLLDEVDYLPEYLAIAHLIKDAFDLDSWINSRVSTKRTSKSMYEQRTQRVVRGLKNLSLRQVHFSSSP